MVCYFKCNIPCMIIYKTTNLINGRIYVGKDSKNNPKYLGSGCYLNRAIKKYGRENFKKEVLEFCNSPKELNQKEKDWIKKLDTTDKNKGYNLTEGGDGGYTCANHSEKRKKDHLEKLRQGAIKFGKSKEGKKFCSARAKKMWSDPNYRAFMSKKMTGRKITWKKKISKSIKKHWKTRNREVSQSTRHKLSKSIKGRFLIVIPENIQQKICQLFNEYSVPKIRQQLLKQNIDVSHYLIRRILKKHNLYGN